MIKGILTDDGHKIFQLLNGVTGSESFYMDTGTNKLSEPPLERMKKHGWRACVGVKGSWSDLFIPPEEMAKVIV